MSARARRKKTGPMTPTARAGWAALAGLLAIGLGYATVAGSPGNLQQVWVPFGVYAATVLTATTVLALTTSGVAASLYLTPLLLSGIGLVLQYRLGELDPSGQRIGALILIPLAVAGMLAVSLLFHGGRVRLLAAAWALAWLAMAGVLGAILIIGQRFRGALYLPGGINPSDIVKPLFVLFVSGFITRYMPRGRHSAGAWAGLLVACAVPLGLLLLQRDLGLVILLCAVLAGMAYLHTRSAWIPVGAVLGAAAGMALISVAAAHGVRRFEAWWNPFADETGAGWQILQALSAMYQGGLWGAGIGEGQPGYIPIASSDFVYAALGEELGFAGCGLILLLYLVFFRDGFRCAALARDPFVGLAAYGMTLLLALQAFLNLGGVTKFIPLTGIPLPWLSRGGSSLVTSFVMAGLLLAITGEPRRRKSGNSSPRPKKKRVDLPVEGNG